MGKHTRACVSGECSGCHDMPVRNERKYGKKNKLRSKGYEECSHLKWTKTTVLALTKMAILQPFLSVVIVFGPFQGNTEV